MLVDADAHVAQDIFVRRMLRSISASAAGGASMFINE